LAQRDLRFRLFDSGRSLVECGFQLFDVLLRLGERRFLLIDDVLVGPGIDLEEDVACLRATLGLTGTSTTRPFTSGTIGVV
jgi:hypothetical protein